MCDEDGAIALELAVLDSDFRTAHRQAEQSVEPWVLDLEGEERRSRRLKIVTKTRGEFGACIVAGSARRNENTSCHVRVSGGCHDFEGVASVHDGCNPFRSVDVDPCGFSGTEQCVDDRL
jgi:hypothetical protein